MHLVSWKPHISIDFGIFATGTVKCSICQAYEEIGKGSGYLLPATCHVNDQPSDDLKATFRWIFEPFTKQRSCKNCGVVSAMPKADHEQLLQEAAERISPEWLKKQGEKASKAKTARARARLTRKPVPAFTPD